MQRKEGTEEISRRVVSGFRPYEKTRAPGRCKKYIGKRTHALFHTEVDYS